MCSPESGLPNFLRNWISNVASWGHERNFSPPSPSTEGWKGRDHRPCLWAQEGNLSGSLRDQMHFSFLSKSSSGKRLNYCRKTWTALEGTWHHLRQSLEPQVKPGQRLGSSCLSSALTGRRTAWHLKWWSQPCSTPVVLMDLNWVGRASQATEPSSYPKNQVFGKWHRYSSLCHENSP